MNIKLKIKKEDFKNKLGIKEFDPTPLKDDFNKQIKDIKDNLPDNKKIADLEKIVKENNAHQLYTGVTETRVKELTYTKDEADKKFSNTSGTPSPQNSTFTYDGSNNLTRIDYADGSYKTFTYSGSDLDYMQYYKGGLQYTKTFVYSAGDLINIVIS